jgi:hypothetical protein
MSLWIFVALVCAALFLGLGLQNVGPREWRDRLLAVLSQMGSIPPGVFFTGTNVMGTAVITAVTGIDLNFLKVGQGISGTGVPPGTVLIGISTAAGGTLTMSQVTTVAGGPGTYEVGQSLGASNVHLFKSAYGGGSDPTAAYFATIEADFDTYTSMQLTGGTPIYSNTDGSAESDFGPFAWVLTAIPVTTNLIYGYWVDGPDPLTGLTLKVVTWESFPNPIPMQVAGNAVVFSVPMTAPMPGTVTVP